MGINPSGNSSFNIASHGKRSQSQLTMVARQFLKDFLGMTNVQVVHAVRGIGQNIEGFVVFEQLYQLHSDPILKELIGLADFESDLYNAIISK